MKLGTRSLLFGVHQFLWHPITVWLAWRKLFGVPKFWECCAIFFHDWGYWGSPNMDGKEGRGHPERSARVAGYLLFWFTGRRRYAIAEEILGHSRWYAKKSGVSVSRLCAADKLSVSYDPEWFYMLRAWATGELVEYKRNAGGKLTDEEWFRTLRSRSRDFAVEFAKNRKV